MKKILIIEDDIGICQSLKLYLENSNFEILIHHEGGEAIDKIKKHNPDLIILDINLPKKDGIKICKELRLFSKKPIIMLTARSGELDKINGLEIGADDYIAKPFSPRELLARIKSILRRLDNEKTINTSLIKFKDIEIDIEKKLVFILGNKISLTKNEYDILLKIIKEDGRLVSRETLMTKVIGYEKYIYDRTIDTHIKNLRKKIGNKDIIITIRGEGYRLNK